MTWRSTVSCSPRFPPPLAARARSPARETADIFSKQIAERIVTPAKKDPIARVRALALKLPDVEEGTTFGYPAFKVGGKAFAWFPKKKEVEPDSLGVRMTIVEREHRIKARPDAFYVTPHYYEYPSVLARVTALSDADLRELLASGHEYMTTNAKASRAKPRKRR